MAVFIETEKGTWGWQSRIFEVIGLEYENKILNVDFLTLELEHILERYSSAGDFIVEPPLEEIRGLTLDDLGGKIAVSYVKQVWKEI